MNEHRIHDDHPHTHGPACGHKAIQHNDHQDYLHDGHLHFPHDGHVDEHVISVGERNPADCTPIIHAILTIPLMFTVRHAGMKRYHMAIMSIIWLTVTYTIPMAPIVMITGWSRSANI